MLTALKELLFSPRGNCLGCLSPLGVDTGCFCADCYASIAPLFVSGEAESEICLNCGEEYVGGVCRVCKKRRVDTIRAVAVYEYEGAIRNLVHSFKFGGVWRASRWMAEEMMKACQGGFLDGVNVLIPVPMHRMRRLMRGFNQSEKLARAFSLISGIAVDTSLTRVRNTTQQVRLSGEKRRQNLKNAFRAERSFDGETVLLVDDVRTTGTTAVECAKALLSASAAEVRVLTFAKATPNKPQNKKYRPDRGTKLIKYEKDLF